MAEFDGNTLCEDGRCRAAHSSDAVF